MDQHVTMDFALESAVKNFVGNNRLPGASVTQRFEAFAAKRKENF